MTQEDGQITRRGFLERAGVAAAAALVAPRLLNAAAAASQPARRPNIVYIMTDDQRWDGLSIEGNAIVETPHLDALARGALRFRNAFVTNSLCSPSRLCYLTGKYSHTTGTRDNNVAWRDQPMFVDPLRKAGYQTCFIGKCHGGAAVMSKKVDLWLGFGGQGQYMNMPLPGFDGKIEKTKGHITDVLTDRAVEYLKDHRKDPFCLFLWHKAPHRDWQPAERHRDLYADKKLPLPATFNTDYKGKPSAVKNTEMRVEIAKGKMPFEQWVKDYYRTLAGVDDSVGRVMKTLEELKLAEDTIVVFTSDNGFFLGEHHFFDKRLMYEPSIRVPMIVRYPRLLGGKERTREEMVLNVDLAPTLLDLCGLDVPADVQGRSWRPLLEASAAGSASPDWRKSWYYEYYEYPAAHMVRPNRGVRTERWKYIEYPAFKGRYSGKDYDHQAEYELYDMKTDPDEAKNLYGQAEHATKVEELRAEMLRLRKELKDPDLGT